MYWQKRFDRKNPDQAIEERILELRLEHKDFGCKRLHGELRKEMIINKKKVHRIIKKLGLQVYSFTRKSRKFNSYKGSIGKEFPNRINRRFDTSITHQKITTDMSEFKYYELDANGNMRISKLYLNPFMDMFNREILSFSIDKRPTGEAVVKALDEVIEITKDCKYRRTFHSDRGGIYQMKNYTKRLKDNKIFQSMSRKGNCLDNAVMENFFSILKQEIYYGYTYHSYEELERTIREYIDYYNHKRIKEKLKWLSPVEYRERCMAA